MQTMIERVIKLIFLVIMFPSLKKFEFIPATRWSPKELLNEEFKSLGFYISNHPLNEYVEIFHQLKIISFDKFIRMMVKTKH